MYLRAAMGMGLLAALLLQRCGSTCRADDADKLRGEVDRLVEPLIKNEAVVGLAIGVRRGDTEFFVSYGHIKLGGKCEPTPDTVYEIGSLSKAFTGTILADMSLRHEADVEAPVQDYLPAGVKMPVFKDTPVTLAHLATHSSGLPRLPTNMAPADPANPYADYTRERLFDFLNGYELTREPGEYEYSNLGMGLLGQLLADRAGKPYEELLEERICQPLDMKDTRIALTPEMRNRLAPPYNGDLGQAKNWDLGSLAGAGGIRSTARDLLKFASAMMADDEKPVTQALKLAGQPRTKIGQGQQQIGLAWHVAGDGVTRWHNGQTGGYSSYAACCPPAKIAVVVLCNTASDVTTDLGERIVQTAAGMKVDPPDFRPAAKVPEEVLKRYVGKYWLSPLFVLTVKCVDGRLTVEATGQDAYRVYPSSETEFFYRAVDARITFVVNDKGIVEKLVLHQNGRDMDCVRQPD